MNGNSGIVNTDSGKKKKCSGWAGVCGTKARQHLRGYKLLADVVAGVKSQDGESVEVDHSKGTADVAAHQI